MTLRIVGVVQCWRCGCAWCPLYWGQNPNSPLLFPVIGADFIAHGGPTAITDPVPYLPCDGCGQVTARLWGIVHVVAVKPPP